MRYVLLAFLALAVLVGSASAQSFIQQPVGFSRFGCNWVSGSTASVGMPDSLVAPAGTRIARLDVWNTSIKPTTVPEALTAIVQVTHSVNGAGSITTYYASKSTSTWNTAIFMGATGSMDKWEHTVSSRRIWLSASGATAHWSWCAYLVPAPSNVATGVTIGDFTQ